jgi:radical SAM superfamily enzyme YgiQ (UPF0313 family)
MTVVIVDLETALPTLTSQFLMPRHGVFALGTALAEAGHSVSIQVECLNGVKPAEMVAADVVGFAVTYPNITRVAALAKKIKEENPRAVILAGGPHATLSPAEVLGFADVVVRDEGEVTAVEVLQRLERGAPLDGVAGVSFRRNGRAVHTPRRGYTRGAGGVEDLGLLGGFRRLSRVRQLARGRIYCGYATASRGCPFPCTFCYENMIGGTGHRPREVGALVEDIRRKKEVFGTNRFWFADSNFATNPSHTRAVLRSIIGADLRCHFTALCRIDVGKHPDILDLMREAGVVTLSFGMEAIEDGRLASIEKRQTVDAIVRTVGEVHRRGMAAFGLFMVGFDGDTGQTPWRITRFCRDHGVDGLSIYCLTESPNLPGRTLPRYRICDPNPDYYTGHFVTTFPRDVRPSVLERSVFGALLNFYHPRHWLGIAARRDWHKFRFQVPLALQFRRMAQISATHQLHLAEAEAPYYDRTGRLDEDLLRRRPVVAGPLPPDTLAAWRDPADPGAAPTPLTLIEPPLTVHS